MRQADLDHWLLDGPSNLAYQGEDVLAWAAALRIAPRLVLTRPVSPTGVAAGQAQRQALIHTLLHDPGVPPSTASPAASTCFTPNSSRGSRR